MVNYSNSIIYKLCCLDSSITDIYIGSTTNKTRRKNHHKTCCNNVNNKDYNIYVYQFIRENGGFDNWDFVEIERVNAIDKSDLHKRERFYIESLKSTLNKVIPTRTKKQYNKDNTEKKAEYNKHYQINHKEQIIKQQKGYRIDNHEKISNKKKILMTCQCGSIFRKNDLSRHKKSQKHKLFIELNNYIYS